MKKPALPTKGARGAGAEAEASAAKAGRRPGEAGARRSVARGLGQPRSSPRRRSRRATRRRAAWDAARDDTARAPLPRSECGGDARGGLGTRLTPGGGRSDAASRRSLDAARKNGEPRTTNAAAVGLRVRDSSFCSDDPDAADGAAGAAPSRLKTVPTTFLREDRGATTRALSSTRPFTSAKWDAARAGVDTDTARERSEVRARAVGEGQSAEGRRREVPREDRIRGGAEVLEIRAGDALLSLREAETHFFCSRNRALDRVTNPENSPSYFVVCRQKKRSARPCGELTSDARASTGSACAD